MIHHLFSMHPSIKETDEDREERLRQEEMARNYKKLYSPSMAEEKERVARMQEKEKKTGVVDVEGEFFARWVII